MTGLSDLSGLSDRGGDLASTPTPDGKQPIAFVAQKTGEYSVRAKFPGDGTFAAPVLPDHSDGRGALVRPRRRGPSP